MNRSISPQTALDLISAVKPPKSPTFNPAPHCTNPQCRFFHHNDPHDTSWRSDHGTYSTKAFGTVQRYRCHSCGKTFSTQSFSMDYWVHHPVDYLPLIQNLVSTSGQGNMSRFHHLRYEVIQNRYERISRFFLALHAYLRSHLSLEEDFVLDGFESFSCSQFFPNNINLLVGDGSEFIYGMGYAQLRRKGRMTDAQKRRRAELEAYYGKAPPKAVETSVASLIEDLCILLSRKPVSRKLLKTDEHKAYVRALQRMNKSAEYLEHVQYSSKAARTPQNPLFPVNYVDRQIRKDQINHVRETVQFARCPAAMMVRLTVYQGYHNYLMPRRVRAQRKGNWETRGEHLGLRSDRVLAAIGRYWGRRVFLNKSALWESEKMTWLLGWRNQGMEMGRRQPQYTLV